jgi:hypothetical protein
LNENLTQSRTSAVGTVPPPAVMDRTPTPISALQPALEPGRDASDATSLAGPLEKGDATP